MCETNFFPTSPPHSTLEIHLDDIFEFASLLHRPAGLRYMLMKRP